jgi:hypothetical protein
MLSQFCQNPVAFTNLNTPALQPSTTLEFQNTCQSITNIDYTSSSVDITIFPNPATDFIQIMNIKPESKIQISNIFGQVVFSGIVSSESKIDLSTFSSGYYNISVLDCQERINTSFLKR